MAKTTRNYLMAATVIIVSILSALGLASMKKPAEKKAEQNLLQVVPVIAVENTDIFSEIPVIGQLSAHEKIDIYAEVSGVMKIANKDFLTGVAYNKGETIVSINSDESFQALIAKRSNLLNLVTQILPDLKFDYTNSYKQWYQYVIDFDINKSIQTLPDPVNDQEKFFITGKGIYQSYYDIVSSETRLQKYTIEAPFNGIVSMSNLKPGSLVMNGQKIGEFFNPSIYDFEAELSVSDLQYIEIGNQTTLKDTYTDKVWTGKVSRISQNIDSRTQTVKIYVSIDGKGLKEGQYLSGSIRSTKSNLAMELSRKLIINDKEVLLVVDSVLKSYPVEIIRLHDNTALVAGLPEGALISQKTKGLHEGIKVKTEQGRK